MAQRDDCTEQVGELKRPFTLYDAPDKEYYYSKDETAIEHEATLIDAYNVHGTCGKLALPVLDHVSGSTADDA